MKHTIRPETSRRTFVRIGLMGALALPLAKVLTACTKGGDGGGGTGAPSTPLVKIDPATNPTAKALGYNMMASKVDTAQYPKKAGPDGASQYCENCSFFNASADHSGWGNCTLISGGLVTAKGWCNSWAKKA